MNIRQVVEVLRVRCRQVAWENYTSAVNQNIGSAKLFNDGKSYVDQILVVR